MPTVNIRKVGAAQQIHSVEGGRAVITEHGYRIKITVDLDYNRLTNRQIPHAHNQIHSLVQSALDTGDELRGNNPALIEVDELAVPLFGIEMDTEHQ